MPDNEVKGLTWTQRLLLLAFAGLVVLTSQWVRQTGPQTLLLQPADLAVQPSSAQTQDPAEAARCKVPDFAKAIGHEAQWKLHNRCQ